MIVLPPSSGGGHEITGQSRQQPAAPDRVQNYGKMLVNALYHSAVVSGLAAGYARLGKMAIGDSPPKLDFKPRDVGMVVVDVALAMATKDMLIKQGLIPADILK